MADLGHGQDYVFNKVAGGLNPPSTDNSTRFATTNFVKENGGGKHWQAAVLDQIDFTSAEPASPSLGDRYINTATGTSSVTAQSVTATYIYEWNGTDWTETVPEEGFVLYDLNDGLSYTYNDLSQWVVFGSTALVGQKQVYYVSQEGNDSDTGDNVNEMFVTIGAARTAAIADTPTSTNQIAVIVLDNHTYTESFTGASSWPSHVHLYMGNAVLNGAIQFSEFSEFQFHDLIAPVGGATTMQKTSGSGESFVHVTGEWAAISGSGISNTSTGALNAKANYIEYNENFIPNGVTGPINLQHNLAWGNSANAFINHNGTSNINIDCNQIRNNDDIIQATAACTINLKANKLESTTQKIFELSGGAILNMAYVEGDEAVTSTVTGASVNYITSHDDSGHAVIRSNDRIRFEVGANNPVSIFSNAISVNNGYDLNISDDDQINLGDSHMKSNYQTFSNLGTTPVALNATFNRHTLFFITLRTTDNRSNSFMIMSDYNSGVPELVLSDFNENNGTVTQSPAGTFNISVNGYATASFNLVITTTGASIGDTTLAASSATTGTTRLFVYKLSNLLT